MCDKRLTNILYNCVYKDYIHLKYVHMYLHVENIAAAGIFPYKINLTVWLVNLFFDTELPLIENHFINQYIFD